MYIELLLVLLILDSSTAQLVTSDAPTDVGDESTPDSDQTRVFVLQKSGAPSASSFAHLMTPFPKLIRSFTVCYRIRLVRFREESTLMSYAVSNDKDNELRMDHRLSGYKVSLHSKWAQTKLITPLLVWTHFCFLYDFFGSKWTIFMNGEEQANGTFPSFNEPLLGNGAFIIGQEQDAFAGGFQRDQSYSGYITQLNFWDSLLDSHSIAKIARCEDEGEGDVLGWSEQEWKLSGEVYAEMYDRKSFCEKSGRTFAFFKDRFTLHQALDICKVVGGIVAVPQTAEENALIYESTVGKASHCSGQAGESYLWLGANDVKEERMWSYWGSGENLAWESTWRGGGPNGGALENCLVMLYDTNPGYWSDIACLDSYAFCVPCEFNEIQVMHLKGSALCPGSPFNLQYLIGEEKDGHPSFIGYFHTDIFWNGTMGAWVLQSLKFESAMAWWKPPNTGMYPFGTKSWTIEYDLCGFSKGALVNLTLSACGRGKFTCSDGFCISIEQRCDMRIDCPDQSDESFCSLVEKPADYQKIIPPPSPSINESFPIRFKIGIIAFPSVATQDLTFITTFQLKLEWKDTRLNFINLKSDRTLNVLTNEAKLSIWTPRVFFSNAHGNVFTNLDRGSRVECVQGGEPRIGGPHRVTEMMIFSGEESSLEMSQLYTVTYSCDFDLLMFPFDAQVCHMNFMLVSASSAYMKLIPYFANYTGRPNLIEYSIGQVTIKESETTSEFSTVSVEVRFARRYGFYVLTLYIPTTLLICISYATLFFNPDDFNSRIVVGLTSLLVLSSLYTQTSNSLPKTSYFKLVDVWLFFSIVMIFLVVMLQTLIDFSQQPILSEGSRLYQFWNKIFGGSSGSLVNQVGGNSEENQGRDSSSTIRIKVNGVQDGMNGWTRENTDINQEQKSFQSTREYQLSRLPVYNRSVRRGNWRDNQDVNMNLMFASRIFVPSIFLIFNCCYWGAAMTYVFSIFIYNLFPVTFSGGHSITFPNVNNYNDNNIETLKGRKQ